VNLAMWETGVARPVKCHFQHSMVLLHLLNLEMWNIYCSEIQNTILTADEVLNVLICGSLRFDEEHVKWP